MTDALRRMRHYGHRRIAGVRVDFAVGILVGVLVTIWARRALGQSPAVAALEKAGLLEPAFDGLVKVILSIAAACAAAVGTAFGFGWRKATKVLDNIAELTKSVAGLADTVRDVQSEGQQRRRELQDVKADVHELRQVLLQQAVPTPRPAETQEVKAPTAIRRHTGG